jgi:hypothetical protein
MCQRLDVEKAAEEGVPLTLDLIVENQFTHKMSVRLHLEVIRLSSYEGQVLACNIGGIEDI